MFGRDSFFLFLVVVVTLIPFYHGAFRHMDDIYIFPEAPRKRPGPRVLLVDYLLLMFEAGLLVWLATSISNLVIFTQGFVFLMAVDVLWAAVTGILTPAKSVFKWGILKFYCWGNPLRRVLLARPQSDTSARSLCDRDCAQRARLLVEPQVVFPRGLRLRSRPLA